MTETPKRTHAPPLKPENWEAIRQVYEYGPDRPSLAECARRAGTLHGFRIPSAVSVYKRSVKEGWQRYGTIAGITQAAQRKADRMVKADGSPEEADPAPREIPSREVREESEDKRAEVLARHRREWRQVVMLRQEAVDVRETDLEDAAARIRFAKQVAETTQIQQAGERKAWGLDDFAQMPDMSQLSDAQLMAFLSSKE